jgi:Tfp pilus assembly protein PilX
MVVLVLLVILTVIVLASANVSLFDQRTAVNENRARLAEQAAEYALNIGGNFMKANVQKIPTIGAGGWLDTATAANRRWTSCAGFTDAAYAAANATNKRHPCYAEPVESRRTQMYYYTTDGTSTSAGDATKLNVYDSASPPAVIPAGARMTTVGGSAAFPVTTTVRALLCRLDTTAGSTPSCQLNPSSGNRFAVTLIAESTLTGESSSSVVKETWATFNAATATSAVPLVASALVQGLGNATIVAAPNAGGYGLPGSIWSPMDVDIDDSGAGIGSVSTCHLGDYLGSVPVADLKTTCAGNGNTGCGCPTSSDNFLSGHNNSIKRESVDILDIDGQPAGQPLPDIQFYPGRNASNTRLDDPNDNTDDNLFEWIFGVDVTGGNGDTVLNNCGGGGTTNCEVQALTDMGATVVANCNGLNSSSAGIYYVTGSCSLPGQVGSPTNDAIVVVDSTVTVGSNALFYGMLFVRSTTSPAQTASLTGHGNPKIFGSLVVEGNVNLTGNLDLIYSDTGSQDPGDAPSENTRFARVPGTWFDSMRGS